MNKADDPLRREASVKNLLSKVEKVTKEKKLDLSSDEDLSIAIMNLIAIEEHLFFTSQKTGKNSYLDLLNEVRQMRKELLKEIITDYEGEVWCFPPNTVVYGNPEPKKINEFSENDKVLTHKGIFQSVERTFQRSYDGELISISPYYADSLQLTPGHEVLCAIDVRKKQEDLWRKNFSTPEIAWKRADNLTDLDFLLFPRYQDIKDIDELEIEYQWTNTGCFKPTTFTRKQTIKIDADLLKLIGLYLSEGSISERRYHYKNTWKTTLTLYFSFGKHEKELIEETKTLFNQIFQTSLKTSETKTTTDLVCSQRVIASFFKQFGHRSKEKQLPHWVIKLPNEKLFPLLWGLVSGDGSVDKYQISYFTSSEKLAYQLRVLLFKLGILHTLKKVETKGGKIGERKIRPSSGFNISISGDAARIINSKTELTYNVNRTSGNFGFVLDDYIMIPIRKIEKVHYNGPVYNLQTEAQTYTTFTGVVHNCISKHLLASSMRLMEVGTKELGKGDKKKSWSLFTKAYNLYSLFWGINLNIVKTDNVKRADQEVTFLDEKNGKKGSSSVFDKLGAVVQKAIDCCRE